MAGEWRLLEETWISSELVVTPESRPTKNDPSWSRPPEEITDDESPVFSVEAEENQVPSAHTNTDSSRESHNPSLNCPNMSYPALPQVRRYAARNRKPPNHLSQTQ